MVTSLSVYLGSFVSFIVLFGILREKGYPNAEIYILSKKTEIEKEIENLKTSLNFDTFKRLHSKLHEYERLKTSVDRYIVCSKWSCISIIASSLLGVFSVYFVPLLNLQNTINFLMTIGTIIFFVSTTSIPTVSELLTKFMKR